MLNKGQYYPKQDRTEKIIMFIHRHWMSYLIWAVPLLSAFLLPVVLITLFNRGNITISSFFTSGEIKPEETINNIIAIITISTYYLALTGLGLKMWIDHYLDVIIVSQTHLTNVQQIGLLNHKVSEQSLLRVQDVTARINGFWQTYWGFGTVVVETAGDEPNFLMENVPNPNSVANMILKLHEELIESGGLEEETAESVGENRPMIARKKHKEIINKIVYNLPPNKNLSTGLNEAQIQTPTEEKITELDDSKVVIIQTPKAEKKHVEIHPQKNSVKKIETSPKKFEGVEIESSWTQKINTKTEEGELKEGQEIKL